MGTSSPHGCRTVLMKGLYVAWWVGLLMLAGCEGTDRNHPERMPKPETPAPAGDPIPNSDHPESRPNTRAQSGGTTDAMAIPSPGVTDTGTTAAEIAPELTESAPAQPGSDGKTFTVDARVLDRGKSAPHCGILHLVVVMKLEVVTVIDGRYGGGTLYVYVSCPEMWLVGKPHRFEVGRVYRWTLDTRIERRTAGAKIDAFRAVKAPRYRLEKLDELPR